MRDSPDTKRFSSACSACAAFLPALMFAYLKFSLTDHSFLTQLIKPIIEGTPINKTITTTLNPKVSINSINQVSSFHLEVL